MRAAGGGQSVSRNRALRVREGRDHVPRIEFRRGRAVEADESNVRVNVEEGAKIVRNRIIRDGGIETAGARGGSQHVPERDAMLDQYCGATGIVRRQVRDPSGDDLLKDVLGIGVILPALKRQASWQAPENQDASRRR